MVCRCISNEIKKFKEDFVVTKKNIIIEYKAINSSSK